MEVLWQRAQELCLRVESALGGRNGHARICLDSPAIGARCRAKWAGDGLLYDAEVQNVLADGTIVVNWLRPRPESIQGDTGDGSPAAFGSTPLSPSKRLPARPIITVSEHGGDDSCHRFLQQEDVHLLEGDPASTRAVQTFLEARSDEDRVCVNCGTDEAEYASVSFGTYLCCKCADEMKKCAPNLPLRQLADIWSWSKEDLIYMSHGGNSTFTAILKDYPDIVNASLAERYTSKFAEYYRRRVEALTLSLPPPQVPLSDVAGQPGKSPGDFFTSPEAKHVAHVVVQTFEAWACQARRKLPKPAAKPVSRPPLGASARRQPLVVEGCGTVISGSPMRSV